MTSDTPRTDAAEYSWNKDAPMAVDAAFARQLERELAVLLDAIGDVASSMDNGWSDTLWDAVEKVDAMRREYEEGSE